MSSGSAKTVESYVPPGLDRLPFSRWYVLAIATNSILPRIEEAAQQASVILNEEESLI